MSVKSCLKSRPLHGNDLIRSISAMLSQLFHSKFYLLFIWFFFISPTILDFFNLHILMTLYTNVMKDTKIMCEWQHSKEEMTPCGWQNIQIQELSKFSLCSSQTWLNTSSNICVLSNQTSLTKHTQANSAKLDTNDSVVARNALKANTKASNQAAKSHAWENFS